MKPGSIASFWGSLEKGVTPPQISVFICMGRVGIRLITGVIFSFINRQSLKFAATIGTNFVPELRGNGT